MADAFPPPAKANGANGNGNGVVPPVRLQAPVDDAPAAPPLYHIERALVAGVLLDPSAGLATLEQLGVTPETLDDPELRAILRAMAALAHDGLPVEPNLVALRWSESVPAGARAADLVLLEELQDEVASPDFLKYHAGILLERRQRQAMRRTLTRALTLSEDPRVPPAELAAEVAGLLADARGAGSGRIPAPTCALEAPAPEPITWVIENLWTAGDIGLLVGDGGSFKTTAALHMAAAIAGGYEVFGHFRTERKPVLIVSAEDPQSVILQRLDAFIAGHGWDAARVKANVHVLASPDASLADPAWRRALEEAVDRIRPGFLVLDPLAELLGGDENSNTDARPVLKFVRALAARCGAATAIVHHAGKGGPEKRPLDRVRGASAIPSAARVLFFFEFRDDGIAVEHLKMSRAPKLDRFVLGRAVTSEPGNRAMWRSATLTYAPARVHAETRAETFILAQLRMAAEP
jgi:hypothetical protein